MKRIEGNRAVSILGKMRINDFEDVLEEMPSVEYHLTGHSLFDDKFTLYSDTQISRLRQRIGAEHRTRMKEEFFSFISQRVELDMPTKVGTWKMVPFIAGTFGYDDRSGFTQSLVGFFPGVLLNEFNDRRGVFERVRMVSHILLMNHLKDTA